MTAQPTSPCALVHLGQYAGRHQGAGRFDRIFAELDEHVEDGFQGACLGLGLDPVRARRALRERIHVHVRDADCRRYGGDRARCRTVVRAGVEEQHIDLFAEYFLSGDSDLRTVVAHEMVHAVMRARLGRARYGRLPHWLREGLAIHIAEEGPHHLRRTLLAHGDPRALMTGLMVRKRSLVMYPYAWLAIDYLDTMHGAEGIHQLVRGLLNGGDYRALFQKVTGRNWKHFLAAVRTHAHRRIEREASGLSTLQEAQRLYHRGRYDEARAAFTTFLDEHADSAFAPTARYYRARAWYCEQCFDEAAAGFQDCILSDLGDSGWIDECHLFLGLARHEQERDKAAVAVLRDYIELHPYADQHDLASLALGRALGRLGQPEAARSAFEALVRNKGARVPHRQAASRELETLAELGHQAECHDQAEK